MVMRYKTQTFMDILLFGMIRAIKCSRVSAVFLMVVSGTLGGVFARSAHGAVIVFDNTNDKTNPLLPSSGGAIINATRRAFTFTANTNLSISTFTAGIYIIGIAPASDTVSPHVQLFNADGSGNPTGAALASFDGAGIDITDTAAYFTFDLSGSGFDLTAGQDYSMVLWVTDSLIGTPSWANIDPNTAPTSGTGDLTYIGTRFTNDSGASWSNSSNFNSIQLTVVPEPAAFGLLGGAGLLAFFYLRRTGQ